MMKVDLAQNPSSYDYYFLKTDGTHYSDPENHAFSPDKLEGDRCAAKCEASPAGEMFMTPQRETHNCLTLPHFYFLSLTLEPVLTSRRL